MVSCTVYYPERTYGQTNYQLPHETEVFMGKDHTSISIRFLRRRTRGEVSLIRLAMSNDEAKKIAEAILRQIETGNTGRETFNFDE